MENGEEGCASPAASTVDSEFAAHAGNSMPAARGGNRMPQIPDAVKGSRAESATDRASPSSTLL